MARYLLDTNIFTFIVTKQDDMISRDVRAILDDYDNEFLMSMESVKELLVAYRKKKLLPKFFKSPIELIASIDRDYHVRILQVDMEVMRTMATLVFNEAQEHCDPSDHIIISHALTLRLPLISSDTKFPFYRAQGLELVENR